MVAERVEIITKTHKDEPAAHWTCDGSPKYTLEAHDKTDRGTEIILHIAEDSTEFLEEGRIMELLTKYNKFMPIPIKFGTKTETLPLPEDAALPQQRIGSRHVRRRDVALPHILEIALEVFVEIGQVVRRDEAVEALARGGVGEERSELRARHAGRASSGRCRAACRAVCEGWPAA